MSNDFLILLFSNGVFQVIIHVKLWEEGGFYD